MEVFIFIKKTRSFGSWRLEGFKVLEGNFGKWLDIKEHYAF